MNFVLYTYFLILALEQNSLFFFLMEVQQIECVVLWCYVSYGGLYINGQLILFSIDDACPRLQSQVIPEQIQGTFQLFFLSTDKSLNTEDLALGAESWLPRVIDCYKVDMCTLFQGCWTFSCLERENKLKCFFLLHSIKMDLSLYLILNFL